MKSFAYDEGKYEARCNFETFIVAGQLFALVMWLVLDLLEVVRILNMLV
jgi:hypothetical protein